MGRQLLPLFFLAVPLALFGQPKNVTLKIRVKNCQTHEQVETANISVTGSSEPQTRQTNNKGETTFTLSPGYYRILASAPGYMDINSSLHLDDPKKEIEMTMFRNGQACLSPKELSGMMQQFRFEEALALIQQELEQNNDEQARAQLLGYRRWVNTYQTTLERTSSLNPYGALLDPGMQAAGTSWKRLSRLERETRTKKHETYTKYSDALLELANDPDILELSDEELLEAVKMRMN